MEARTDYEDTDDKYKVIDLKRKLNTIDAEEKMKHEVFLNDRNNSQELVQRRKEQELEKIVRKKIELEKIAEERKKLNDQYKHVVQELEVISEEKDTRDINNVKILEKALNRANVKIEFIIES